MPTKLMFETLRRKLSPASLRKRFTRRHKLPPFYHVIPLHEYRALYFAIPKVANSSLKSICFDLMGLEAQFPGQWSKPYVFTMGYVPLPTKQEIRQQYSNYWKFGFVRNPWDRLVSCYYFAIPPQGKAGRADFISGIKDWYFHRGFVPGMSFAEFAERVASIPDARADRHFMSQHCYLSDEKGQELMVDFVGRFERLSEDFEYVRQHLAIEGAALPHLQKSSRPSNSYRELYDERLKQLVAERYARDIELFAYSF